MELNHEQMEAIEMKKHRVNMLDGKQAVVLAAVFALLLVLPGVALANTMIHNSTNLGTTYGQWGVAGQLYGAFDCSTCHGKNTGNIKRVKQKLTAQSGSFPIQVDPSYNVVFLDVRNGTSDFGDDSIGGRTLGDTRSDKICEACHTQTKYHNFNVNNNVANGGDRAHYNNQDCTTCHPHNQGFKPVDCTACHGMPPTTTDRDGSTTTGLANNKPGSFWTGSTIVGAHDKHATVAPDLNYDCNTCHNGYVMPDAGDINISFNAFGDVSGTYDGQSTATYDDVSGGDTLTCSSIYCHGSSIGGTAPTWDGAAMTCGDCHDAAKADVVGLPSSASHDQHARVLDLDCSKCHGAGYTSGTAAPAGHVGGNVSWALDTTDNLFGATAAYNTATSGDSGERAPSVAYGDCTNIYCHSSGQNASGGALGGVDYATPTWGGAVSCGDCHATTTLASGSHNAHLTFTGTSIGCDKCHTGATAAGDDYPSIEHVDQTIDVAAGLTYSQGASSPPANNYGNCSTTVCHGNSTPTWGGGSMLCDSCHGANSSMPGSHGAHYNVGLLADSADLVAANNAASGNYEFSCGVCHDSATHVGGEVSGNQRAEVLFNSAIAGGSASYAPGALAGNDNGMNFTAGTCSTTYCHSDGNGGVPNTTAVWNGAAMNCGSCHDAEPGASGTARHTEHVKDSEHNFNCSECHVVTTTDGATIADKRQHVDGGKDVNFDTLNADGTAYVDAATNCSNIYCHSDGKNAAQPYNAPKTAVKWDTATPVTCTICHDGASSTTTLSGAHAAHFNGATLQTIGTDLGCADCHADTVSDNTTISDYSQHVDKVKTIKVAIDNTTCNNIQCHSDGNFDGTTSFNNPAWGSNLDCQGCHGGNIADGEAFPDYADGGTPAGGDSNSHNAHVGSSNISCEECHDGTTTNGTAINDTVPSQHVNQVVDMAFKQGGSMSAGEQCSNTYCHGVAASPVWGTVGATNCASCHGASKAMPGSHAAHYNSAVTADGADLTAANNAVLGEYEFSCGVCHDGTAHAGGPVTTDIQEAQVIFNSAIAGGSASYAAGGSSVGDDNGFDFSAGTCSTTYCHSDGNGGAPNTAAVWNGLAMNCGSCHDAEPGASGTARHTEHVKDSEHNFNCSECHVVTTTDGATIADKRQHVDGGKDVNFDTLNADGTAYVDAATSCSNIYCHSDGKNVAQPYNAPLTAVQWDTATPVTCTICHDGAGTTSTLSASHLVHIGTDATDTNKQFGFDCEFCHTQTVSSSSVISNFANHINKSKDVAVSVANGGTGTIGGDFASDTCATTQCHGSTTPTWTAGATTTGDCSACHGMAASTADGRDTSGATLNTDAEVGAHVAHLTSAKNWSVDIGCAECHKTTVDNQTAAGTYVAKVNAAGHIDTAGPAELTFGTVANYNSATPAYSGAPGGTCATTYCHDGAIMGKGWSGTLNVPDWNTPYFTGVASNDCAFCHGYPPNPASGHPNDPDCSVCHTNTVATDDGFVDVSKHINGVVEAEGGSNCLDCHGSGKYKDPVATNPDHADHTDITAFLTGKSLTNVPSDFGNAATGWYNVSYNASSLPVIGCGQCHPADEATFHRNAVVDTKLTPTGEATIPATNAKNHNTAGAAFGGGQCSGVYCHSDGIADGTYPNSPTWGSGTITDCKGCHDNSPSVGNSGSSHGVHVVGIHYRTLYNGAGGLMTEGAASAAAHGDSTTSTTMTCNTCHAFTIDTNSNVGNNTCATCHTPGAGPGDQAMVIAANSTAHLNGAPTVWFNAATFKTKAQLRGDSLPTSTEYGDSWTRNNGYKAGATSHDDDKSDKNADAGAGRWWSYDSGSKTCSTVDCHNGRTTPSWDTGSTVNCAACHTRVPQ